jgi:hypothetical protein
VPPGADLESIDDFEGGRSSWYVHEVNQRFSVVETPTPVLGGRAARCEVRAGDPQVAAGYRCQVAGNDAPNGQERLHCGRFLIPASSDLPDEYASWNLVYEEHTAEGGGSPPIALFVEGRRGSGSFGLRLGYGDGSRTDWAQGGFAVDQWHSFCVRFVSSNTWGWLEFWLDGGWQRLSNGQRRKPFTNPSSGTYTLGGIYRGGAHGGTSITYIDDFRGYRIR